MNIEAIFMDEIEKVAKKKAQDEGISLGHHVGMGAGIGGVGGAAGSIVRTPLQLAVLNDIQKRDAKGLGKMPLKRMLLARKLVTTPLSGAFGAGAGAGAGALTYGLRRLLGAKKKKE